jgi:DNA polymerase I-like protein with 3'-5' exonuclease and polymerase domains
VHRWLNAVLGDETQLKVGANIMYDLGWAGTEGVKVRGPVRDVQWAEALLNEHRWSYALDVIARERLGRGKDESRLIMAAVSRGLDPKADLWRLPAEEVAAYAIEDAALPRDLWALQEPLLAADDLLAICALEHSLMPLYLDMRRRGVRVDIDYAERLRDQLRGEVDTIRNDIFNRVGFEVDLWAPRSVAKAFDAEGIVYGRTAKTKQPSITNELLKGTDHWLAAAVLAARQKDKLAGTFLDGVILGNLHNGRVHGEIHPLRGDDGGTVTGRLSMSDPNLQFIPKRTEEGKRIRRCFIPEEGERWASCDFSQQEPRLVVHFASLVAAAGGNVPGAIDARDRYINDPALSYHQFTADLTGLPYSQAKALNLAIIYGRGIATTAAELHLTHDQTKALFAKHHAELPFAKAMAEACQDVVRRRGYLKSLLGRRVRFPFWELSNWNERSEMLLLDQAKERWPGKRIVRARLHKALNSLIQPSAADQTKAAMRAVLDAGLGKHLLVQVHDELCCSVPDEAMAVRISELMRDAVKLEVPSKVDVTIGANWGLE